MDKAFSVGEPLASIRFHEEMRKLKLKQRDTFVSCVPFWGRRKRVRKGAVWEGDNGKRMLELERFKKILASIFEPLKRRSKMLAGLISRMCFPFILPPEGLRSHQTPNSAPLKGPQPPVDTCSSVQTRALLPNCASAIHRTLQFSMVASGAGLRWNVQAAPSSLGLPSPASTTLGWSFGPAPMAALGARDGVSGGGGLGLGGGEAAALGALGRGAGLVRATAGAVLEVAGLWLRRG